MTHRIDRRRLLGGALLTALACPLCRSAAADEWGYEGAHAPKHWGGLSPEFKMCSTGTMQAPIDLRSPLAGAADSIKRDYKPMPLKITNNGHTIQVNAAPGSTCTVDDWSTTGNEVTVTATYPYELKILDWVVKTGSLTSTTKERLE